MGHIVFQGRKYKNVAINIAGGAPFHAILKKINEITLPDCPGEDEEIRYAIMELINNSLRSHREHGIKEHIRVELSISGSDTDHNELTVQITDQGRGFDINTLPYDITTPAENIDTNSSRFQTYREEHRYQRFGMGLLMARRMFPEFRIVFMDADGNETAYNPETVRGTRITMKRRLLHG